MRPTIECVECRTFLSAATIVADLEVLKADGVRSIAELNAGLKQAVADFKVVKIDTAASHPTATQKQALVTLTKQVSVATSAYKKQVSALIGNGDKAGLRLYGALKSFKAHETAGNLAKVTSGFSALESVFSTQNISTSEAHTAALISNIDTAGNTFATAVPAASSAVATAESHLSADQTTLDNNISGIQAAVTQLGNDLP